LGKSKETKLIKFGMYLKITFPCQAGKESPNQEVPINFILKKYDKIFTLLEFFFNRNKLSV
jgi:hypothetical protein